MVKDQKSNVIKVMFQVPVEGKKEHYFGSLSAIYDVFSNEQIGCSLKTLWKAKIEPGKPKKTKKCVVSKHEVHWKEQKRGKVNF